MDIEMLYCLAGSSILLLLLYFLASKYLWSKYILLFAFLILNGIYLVWRTIYTLPTVGIVSFIFGLLLLAAEWAGYSQSITFTILSWKPFKRKIIPLYSFRELPTVDVFIATYNEPADLLKRTITACLLMRYPKEKLRVYVCDDGKREEIKKMTESLGAYYIKREDNKHAKAGNLNHAMSVTNGDIIVTMDADMVPKINFLERTLGYFKDDQVTFVQAPQVFYNADPFQYNLFYEERLTNEQDFFMRRLEEGKDRFNSTMYVGSNALFRRTALDKIGGFATGVITEDMATGMLLQTKSQKSVFVNETLAVGLSAETFPDLIKQRDRWCRGNIQVARKWNPLNIKGLSLMQRLLYLDGIHYWFFGVYKMIYLLAPLLFLLFSIYSIQTNFSTLIIFWFPAFLSSLLAFRRMADSKRSVLWSHVYEVTLAPYMAFSVLSEIFLKEKGKFNVTKKGIQNNERSFLWEISLPYIILLVMSVISLLLVCLHVFTPMKIYPNIDMLIINVFWVIYNALAIAIALLITVERPRFRGAERFMVNLAATLSNKQNRGLQIPCTITDMSEHGARIEIKQKDFDTFQFISNNNYLYLSTNTLLGLKLQKHWVTKIKDSYYIGISFLDVNNDQYRSLISALFVESIDIYSNKVYENASVLGAIIGFFHKTKKNPKKLNRKSIRQKTNIPVNIQLIDQSIEGKLVDLSNSGCQLKTRKRIKQQTFSFVMKEKTENDAFVQVQWMRKKGLYYYYGLSFKSDNQSMQEGA
ncbi:glycosyltransferase [Niallia nealsonii]|uniref:cellulose synthase (UDP-forming) n=1 Tax=Niallia nealsonii TaxID=115979 RepID=A0A2N0Z0M0_9BACI|nr:glycosyltransferase [Niallia nealsonii]PKG23049.1 cellulose synthase [Niallia nealsonii]